MFFASQTSLSEIAELGDPLKEEYKLNGPGYKSFFKTGKVASSFSYICDMGQALPDAKKEDWYTNKPIPNLRLELRARAALERQDGSFDPMGFVVIVKGDDVLKNFKPLGDYNNGVWEGDVFNSWSDDKTDIVVHGERFGVSGFAEFDMLSGNGFYYKTKDEKSPSYFLSNCRRVQKNNLPVYDWRW